MMLYAGAALGLVLSTASYIGSMHWLKIKYEQLVTNKDNVSGLKILHISDLHSRSRKKINIDIWKSIENLEFDLVAITGDILLDSVCELDPIKEHLARLVKRAPVFFVEGNHEYFIYDQVKVELEKLGIKCLYNECVKFEDKGYKFDIVGLLDFYRLEDDDMVGLEEVFDQVKSPKDFMLVLSHQPQIVKFIEKKTPDLILSGHTHGGQVRFPFLPALFAPGQGLLPKLDHGWYDFSQTKLFISKGIGATHFPIRFYNRPEIAIIEIKK